jgi:hypothetical protein
VFVSGLTVCDYLLWNWSLNSNHDALALVSGLTLPPLAVACLWLLALSLARLIARGARRPASRSGGVVLARRRAPAAPLEETSLPSGAPPRSSDRLAA